MSEQKRTRILMGTVVSNKMDKTIVVKTEDRVKHPVYGKYMMRSAKIKAHDAENACNEGDIVRIKESRPLSKHKSWMLVDIVERAA